MDQTLTTPKTSPVARTFPLSSTASSSSTRATVGWCAWTSGHASSPWRHVPLRHLFSVRAVCRYLDLHGMESGSWRSAVLHSRRPSHESSKRWRHASFHRVSSRRTISANLRHVRAIEHRSSWSSWRRILRSISSSKRSKSPAEARVHVPRSWLRVGASSSSTRGLASFPAVSEADTAAGGVEGTMLMVIAPPRVWLASSCHVSRPRRKDLRRAEEMSDESNGRARSLQGARP